MRRSPLVCVCSLLLSLIFCTASSAEDSPPAAARPVSYQTDILPLFRTKCFGCHQGAKQLGEYRMTDFAAMLSGGESGEAAIVPGDADASYLMSQLKLTDGVAEMPKPPQPPLHPTEIDLIARWINEGAVNDSPAESGPQYTPDNPPRYQAAPTIPSLALSPDEKFVAVAGHHEVIVLAADTGKITHRLVGISPRIDSVAFSHDGSRLAAAGGTPGEVGEIQVWNMSMGELELSKLITFDTLTGICWSPDDTRLSFGANDNVVRAIDSVSGEQVLFQGAHEDWIRDTAFTNDGTHLISVARDMTCKLTEVKTQRFIDNITSITPGALSGGLSSVVIHPSRNEIVVGGADGVVKIYRVFRETARKIGDDANLIRRLPALPGRIRDVAINAEGTYIASVATINGQSEVRVWPYEFDAEFLTKHKNILAKKVDQRSPEEKKLIDEARNQPIKHTLQFELPHAAAYSLDITADGGVWVAAADGIVRHLDPSGKLIAEFPVAEIATVVATDSNFDAKHWANTKRQSAARVNDELDKDKLAGNAIVELTISPDKLRFTSPYQYTQFVAIAKLSDDRQLDVSDLIEIQAHDAITVEQGNLVRPTANATGEVVVKLGDKQQVVGFENTGQENFEVDFVRDVNPVLSRLGCNQGTCHGAQKGKNGFRLSLRGYDPIFDIRALTDDLAARRINPSAPQDSLMIRKPLGLTPHEGGTLMTDGDPYHAVLRRWIADGSRLDLETPRVTSLELFPSNPVVQSTSARQQVRVIAHYADGATRDVTREAFIESGNTEVATSTPGGVLRAVRRGEAPVLARYEGAYAATTLTVMGDRTGYVKPEIASWNHIDELVAQKWERMKIVPSDLCDDATFFRRVHLDLTGLPPTSQAVRDFLADTTPTQQKREKAIDSLIGNEDFIEFWTNKWSDLLQVNRKFLGVEGSKAYREWIRTAVEQNRPYDEFARQIITASGSNQTNPPASYYKVLRTAQETMENTTHLFLGIRFNCNQCHDHPFERWTQDQYFELSAFFAHVNRKKDPASGDRKVGGSAVEQATPLFELIDDTAKTEVNHGRTGKPVAPAFPFELTPRENIALNSNASAHAEVGTQEPGKNGEDSSATTLTTAVDDKPKPPSEPTRREQLAAWITDPGNAYFARSYVNRVWGYLTGVGLIEPIDDIRAGNPASNPELLDYLTDEFIKSGFDSRALMRLICTSRTYGLAVDSNALNADDHLNYSHATPRRLPAEVIFDAVHAITGSTSNLPGMPAGSRAAAATDSGVTSPDGFLTNLGRPVRETACECERSDDLQLGPVMALISGPTIGAAISDPKNELEKLVAAHTTGQSLAEEIFLRAIGRLPTALEVAAFESMNDQIQADHDTLAKRLEAAEASWKTEFERLEAVRNTALADMQTKITARQAEIADEQARLVAARDMAIKDAEAKLATASENIPATIENWIKANIQSNNVEWFPIAPTAYSATGDVSLRMLADRSLYATGKAAQATYTLDFETDLNHITGFRVEALADETLPGGGPGLPDNGNFVVTEIAVHAGADADPAKLPLAKIARGTADFLQDGFAIAPVFDGNAGNQNAWAISPAGNHDHWATFQFAEPIKSNGDAKTKTRLRFVISQNHNAANHLLGRFRISLTTHTSEIPLSVTESLAAAAITPAQQRTEPQTKLLTEYVTANDVGMKAARAAVAEASKPVPADEQLTALQAQQKRLQVVTPIDADLVKLRENVKRSQTQREHYRLTAAEDLVWALINSPAFLFNH